MSEMYFDLGSAFEDSIIGDTFEVRSPHDPKWGYKPEKWTKSQEEVWARWWMQSERYLSAKDANSASKVFGPRIAMIGAKGSGKTYEGAMISIEQAQRFPDSVGMLCSNTFPQLKKSLMPHIRDVARSLGLHMTFHTSVTIHERQYDRVFVIHHTTNTKSFLVMTSFQNIETIEGSEWDYAIFTELQDSPEGAFNEVALTRVRGTKANRGVFVDAMPENADHWQYSTLEDHGFEIWEPSVYENIHNVGEDYVEGLLRSYDEVKARAFVYGERISLTSSSVFYQFNYNTHQKSEIAKELSEYDPTKYMYIVFDFNLEPMCVSVWQRKEYTNPETNETYDVLAQIDEFEVWEGGTPTTVAKVVEKYGSHIGGGKVLGDAAGRQRSTIDPGQTDWKIIKRAFSGLSNFRIQPGLIKRSDGGKVTYSNPPVRDTINRANALLQDAKGRVRVTFLPDSKLESGGVARSVSRLKLKPGGEIDKLADRADPGNRKQPRTHFADTFRYVAYDFTGGEHESTGENLKHTLAKYRGLKEKKHRIEAKTKKRSYIVSSNKRGSSRRIFGR